MSKQQRGHTSDHQQRKFDERYAERRRQHEAQKVARQDELDALFSRAAANVDRDTLRMVRSSGSVCAPWAFGTSRPRPDRRGRTRTSRG
jgi:hypothetical protein